jgi:hypothetical protein
LAHYSSFIAPSDLEHSIFEREPYSALKTQFLMINQAFTARPRPSFKGTSDYLGKLYH